MNGNGVTWEEEAEARLRHARAEEKRANEDLQYWSQYIQALETVLELDRHHRSIRSDGEATYDPESLLKKSVRNAMIEIATENRGLLVTKEAARILVEAGRFTDRNEASANIFSVLSYSKSQFKRERPGIYRLVGYPS